MNFWKILYIVICFVPECLFRTVSSGIRSNKREEAQKVISLENCLLKSNADKLPGGRLCRAPLEFIDFGLFM